MLYTSAHNTHAYKNSINQQNKQENRDLDLREQQKAIDRRSLPR